MTLHRLKPWIATLAVSLLLTACILVKDFGPVWNEAKADPCLNKIAESLYYGEFRRDPAGKNIENLARAFSHGGSNYLLLKQDEDDKGGRLYRFHVRNGIFMRYRLVPTMREQFEKEYPDAPVSLSRDTVSIDALGDKELALLDQISTKDEYWEIQDQTLYNVLANPVCRFEDRDLSVLDQDGAPKKGKE